MRASALVSCVALAVASVSHSDIYQWFDCDDDGSLLLDRVGCGAVCLIYRGCIWGVRIPALCVPVWCGPVWCGPVWCVPDWCGPVWCGPVWCVPV